MQEPELTLGAALRDADSQREDARHKAIRALAAAYLLEAGLASPHWRAADEHATGPRVRDTLMKALRSDEPTLSAMAAVGLGMIGEPDLVEHVEPWVDEGDVDGADSFRRECAVVALSFVGTAAPASGSGSDTRARVLENLRRWLSSPRADVRFQAAVALAEVSGDDAAPDLVSAMRHEDHEEVRENLIDALSRIDPAPEEVLALARELVADEEEARTPVGFEAAMILANARDPASGAALTDALAHRGHRDRALEALAVLGRAAPPEALPRVDALARGWLTPGITRVRAAYALARMVAPATDDRDNPGVTLLRRLAWHPSAAVREAVADAHANLRKLST